MVDNRILKQNARAQLGGEIFKEKWLTMLVACAIPTLAMSLITSLLGGGSLFDLVFLLEGDYQAYYNSLNTSALLVELATLIVIGPFYYGIAKVTLAQVENDKWNILNVFDGFKENFFKSFLLGALQMLFIALWSLLFIIPGIVKSYSYALAFYIQRDKKDQEPVDCISESRYLMKGHKWQLFCLDMSFIGWYIVGALCLGIGTYFVVPYHNMARANFYEALIAEASAQTSQEAPIQEHNTEEEQN